MSAVLWRARRSKSAAREYQQQQALKYDPSGSERFAFQVAQTTTTTEEPLKSANNQIRSSSSSSSSSSITTTVEADTSSLELRVRSMLGLALDQQQQHHYQQQVELVADREILKLKQNNNSNNNSTTTNECHQNSNFYQQAANFLDCNGNIIAGSSAVANSATTTIRPFNQFDSMNNSTGGVGGGGTPTIVSFNSIEHNFSEFATIWLTKSWSEILFRLAFVLPIVLLGIIGNLTIIYSMFKFKRFRSKPTNIFILNMAIADLLTTIVCTNAALITDINQFYVLGAFICRLEGFIKITCLLVSAYSLIVLSADWFLCVVYPCRTRITIRQSWLTLITIWLVSILVASPLVVWRQLRERQWKDLLEVWCCEQLECTKYYWIGITLLLIYLPTFIMTCVLVVILLQMDKFEAKLRRSRCTTATTAAAATTSTTTFSSSVVVRPNNNNTSQAPPPSSSGINLSIFLPQAGSYSMTSAAMGAISGQQATTTTTTTAAAAANARQVRRTESIISAGSSGGGGGELSGSLSISIRYRRKIVKILFAYLLSSIICWSPLQLTIIYRFFRVQPVAEKWFFELSFYAQIFASLSSALNPVIFGYLSQPFRSIVTRSWLFRLFAKLFRRKTKSVEKKSERKQDQAMGGGSRSKRSGQQQQQRRQFSVRGEREQARDQNSRLKPSDNAQQQKPKVAHSSRSSVYEKNKANTNNGQAQVPSISQQVQLQNEATKIGTKNSSSRSSDKDYDNGNISSNKITRLHQLNENGRKIFRASKSIEDDGQNKRLLLARNPLRVLLSRNSRTGQDNCAFTCDNENDESDTV